MKNFVGLKAEIKKQKAIRARLDNEREADNTPMSDRKKASL